MKHFFFFIIFTVNVSLLPEAFASARVQTVNTVNTRDTVKSNLVLPEETSKYNRGGDRFAGRYKDESGSVRLFKLVNKQAPLFDGGGRLIGTVTKPVKLNMGTEKAIKISGNTEIYVWAWNTDAKLSGWIARSALVNPPGVTGSESPFAITNPHPPREAQEALKIDAAAGRARLAGLVHINSKGELPERGNQGVHYAGRNPGPLDYVYLLRAVPNVRKGGTAKDSMPDGSMFVPALDESGRMITEVMTMYRNADMNKPVKVTFVYGRPADSSTYGWIARANIGEL